jgi:hypothetical protein
MRLIFKGIGSVMVGIMLSSLIGCMELEWKIKLYPDGSAKIEEKKILSKELVKMIAAEKKDVKKEIERIVEEENSTRFDLTVGRKITKVGERYQVTQLCYVSEIAMPFEGNIMLEQEKESFVLRLKVQEEGKAKEEMIKAMKEQRQDPMVKDFKLKVTFTVPGKIIKVKGFKKTADREAKLSIDLDKMIQIAKSKEGYYIRFEAPDEEILKEFEEFKKEFEELRKKSEEKR